jgi:hypothetical protein
MKADKRREKRSDVVYGELVPDGDDIGEKRREREREMISGHSGDGSTETKQHHGPPHDTHTGNGDEQCMTLW